MLRLAWAEMTHPGLVRSRNEDAVLAAPPLFAVADGMGGHAAGDVASALTVQTLAALATADRVTRTDVLDAVRVADATIAREASGTTRGMGTTLCGLAVTTSASGVERLVVFNVGDSRAYRLRDGVLEQLTQDHSVVQELVDAGEITERDAATHPDRHVITRSLGSVEHLDIDWWTMEPAVGDRYLLTSDGLTKELDPPEIAAIMCEPVAAKVTASRLVDAALERGGRDNVTVVVVEVTAVGTELDEPDHAESFDPLDGDTSPREAIIGHVGSADATGLDDDTNPAPVSATPVP